MAAKRRRNSKSDAIVPGGVDEYIKACPAEVQPRLREVRSAIRKAAPGSTETVSYFDMPGYLYPGYDYNGMFAWFSFKPPYVRLHVRPPVLENSGKAVAGFATTKAIISFPAHGRMPKMLISKLVKASIKAMKQRSA